MRSRMTARGISVLAQAIEAVMGLVTRGVLESPAA
jgi:hypothetical protein